MSDIDQLILDLGNNIDWEVRRKAARLLGKSKDSRAYTALVEALGDKDNDVRKAAILSLGKLGDARAEESILHPRIINSPDPEVRWAASYVLGQLEPEVDVQIIEKLLRSLEDETWLVRNAATTTLIKQIDYISKKPHPNKVPILLRILAASEYEIYEKAVAVLSEMGLRGVHEVQEIIEALSALSPRARKGAARVLGEMKEDSAVLPLIARLEDQSYKVRIEAACALGKIADLRAITPLISLLGDHKRKVRETAIASLSKFNSQAVDYLLSTLRTVKGRLFRRNIIRALGRIKSEKALCPLIFSLRSSYYVVRIAAMEALIAIKSKKVIDSLLDLLSVFEGPVEALLETAELHQSIPTRIRAIKALGELGDSRAQEALKKLEASDNEMIQETARDAYKKLMSETWSRWCAVRILGEIGGGESVEPLIRRLKDPNFSVRCEAIRALGKLSDDRGVAPLLEMLNEDGVIIKGEALRVLGKIGIGKKGVADAVVKLLEDENSRVRSEAAQSLGRLLDFSAYEPLKKALDDPFWSVRKSVQNALNNLDTMREKSQ